MEFLPRLKATLFHITGITFGIIVESLGGFDDFLKTLVVFMIIDCITGWIVAGIFKESNKSTSGRLDSSAGFRGLVKKCGLLLMVLIASMLDNLMHTNGLTRDAVIIAFILNELLSIIENMGLMGIKMPDALANAIELLGKERKKNK